MSYVLKDLETLSLGKLSTQCVGKVAENQHCQKHMIPAAYRTASQVLKLIDFQAQPSAIKWSIMRLASLCVCKNHPDRPKAIEDVVAGWEATLPSRPTAEVDDTRTDDAHTADPQDGRISVPLCVGASSEVCLEAKQEILVSATPASGVVSGESDLRNELARLTSQNHAAEEELQLMKRYIKQSKVQQRAILQQQEEELVALRNLCAQQQVYLAYYGTMQQHPQAAFQDLEQKASGNQTSSIKVNTETPIYDQGLDWSPDSFYQSQQTIVDKQTELENYMKDYRNLLETVSSSHNEIVRLQRKLEVSEANNKEFVATIARLEEQIKNSVPSTRVTELQIALEESRIDNHGLQNTVSRLEEESKIRTTSMWPLQGARFGEFQASVSGSPLPARAGSRVLDWCSAASNGSMPQSPRSVNGPWNASSECLDPFPLHRAGEWKRAQQTSGRIQSSTPDVMGRTLNQRTRTESSASMTPWNHTTRPSTPVRSTTPNPFGSIQSPSKSTSPGNRW